jgi:hypothetical protein
VGEDYTGAANVGKTTALPSQGLSRQLPSPLPLPPHPFFIFPGLKNRHNSERGGENEYLTVEGRRGRRGGRSFPGNVPTGPNP